MILPPPPPRYDPAYERERNRLLEEADRENVKTVSLRLYQESNVTLDRTFDADTVLLAELADIVGSIIKDLREKGILA